VLPELAQAIEAWRSSSKLPVAPSVGSDGGAKVTFEAPGALLEGQPALEPRTEATATVEIGEEAPPSRPRRRRPGSGGTLLMGSFASPTPGLAAAPRSNRPAVTQTTYRFSSAPPPAVEPKAEKPPIHLLRPPPAWAADPTLMLPLHKSLSEQLCAFALEKCFTVIVTSPPEFADAKSQIAAGLAMTLGELGHPRTLLLEADFHYPAVHALAQVEVPVTLGYSQQLHSRVHSEEGKKWSIIGCSPTLHVLAEGVMRSPGMILSKQFERSLRDLQKYYDLIIIDGPDTSFQFDCRALDSLAEGLVLVCKSPDDPDTAAGAALFSSKRFSTVVAPP
jgi:Mrp family chromosome partitioning ATPase